MHILRGVSPDIPAGQPAAIVGPSGSGKTSLLMVMAGLERASSGAVTVGGNALTRLSEDELAVLRGAEMGIIFQSFHLVPTMTALENVALPMELAGDPKSFDAARDLLHIDADFFREIGDLVDEGDLGGKEGVGGVFDQLGRASLGIHDRSLVE